MPVYNSEKFLKSALDSIVKQTIGVENLQVILVNDCSTDSSKEIIDKYSKKYDNFIGIHLENNIGGAYGPRNKALELATGEYLMFLDSDDKFKKNSCEILYNKTKEYNADISFGRYLRHYPEENIIRKSYTPYTEALKGEEKDYLDDLVKGTNFKGALNFIWKNLISYFFYGKTIKKENPQEIFIKSLNNEIKEEIAILKILPSFWTKIYKTSLIKENNINFPEFISAEDLNFLIEAYFNANGILFLNDTIVYDYYMRFEEEKKSVTKTINFKLVYDSLKAYKHSSDICDNYNFKEKDLFLNPYLLNWILLWLSRKNTKEENKILLNEIQEMKKSKKNGLKYRILLSLINLLLKLKSL